MTSESNVAIDAASAFIVGAIRDFVRNGKLNPNDIQEVMDQTVATINPRTSRPGTFNAAVIELRPGEAVSKIREVDPTITVARLPDEMPAVRTQVRNACAPAVTRARETTGGRYSVEVGDVVMPSGSMYVVAVVKRIE